MSVPDYFNRVNPDLLALIPPDAKTVLEIGCGAGAMCEAYRRINPGVKWIGFDDNREAATFAKLPGRCDRVFEDDFNDGTFEGKHVPLDLKPSDCIIFGDVLEHLTDPWHILKEFASIAAPGAQILASIPNVQHWTVIRDLLRGKWIYTDEGLLDRTHLRFFTLDSIREMFEQAELQVFEIRGRDLCNDGWPDFRDLFCNSLRNRRGGETSALDELQINENEFERRTRAYQYVVRAIKPKVIGLSEQPPYSIYKPIEKLHVHAVLAEGCCARPRILEPFAMLSTVPGVKCTTSQMNSITEFKDWPDIFIQQRFRSLPLAGMINQQYMLDQGSLLIAELDDDPEAIGVDPVTLKAVHAVQVSTERLAETVRQWNPNVMVFENQIADLPPLNIEERDEHEGVNIFYGAQNRESDWAPIMPALNRVLEEHHQVGVRVVHDKAFFDALMCRHKSFWPFCEYDRYRTILHGCCIALLPLEPTRFNEHKSDLKFLECAAEGVAVLASHFAYKNSPAFRVQGYGRMAEFWSERDGKLVDRGFEIRLNEMIASADMRQTFARNAYRYVRDHRLLSQHFRKRLAWYQELLNSKPDLDRQLWERVPELAPRDLVGSSA